MFEEHEQKPKEYHLTTLSSYPMKHLIDFFVPYGSFFETNNLLASMTFILNSFLFSQKIFF